MSSHHFVREGQEPALLITGHAKFSSVEGLLEWAPTIMISADSVEAVLSWGIRIDAVLGKESETAHIRNRFAEEQIVDIIEVPGEGSLFGAATDYLLNRRQNQLAVVADSFTDIRPVVESQLSRISVVVLDNDFRWIPVQQEFRKWSSQSTVYRVVSSEGSTFETEGLRSDLGGYVAEYDGLIRVVAHGLIWIGESYKN